jgi:hypothetical protein
MANHNLSCYSADYACTAPKKGSEADFKEAADEIQMLITWLKEFHTTHPETTREFIGYIEAISYGQTYDKQPRAKKIKFEVDTGDDYCYGDVRIFDIGQEVQNWFIGPNGTGGKYDIERDCRHSRLIKITVDKIEYVRAIEWVVAE